MQNASCPWYREDKPQAVSETGEVTAASLPHAETQEQMAMQFSNQGTQRNAVIGFPSNSQEGHGLLMGMKSIQQIEEHIIFILWSVCISSKSNSRDILVFFDGRFTLAN